MAGSLSVGCPPGLRHGEPLCQYPEVFPPGWSDSKSLTVFCPEGPGQGSRGEGWGSGSWREKEGLGARSFSASSVQKSLNCAIFQLNSHSDLLFYPL